MKRLKQLIHRSNNCPFCKKSISFWRKCTYHGNMRRIEKCPHCNKKIRVAYLVWDYLFYVLAISIMVFLILSSRFNVYGAIVLSLLYFLLCTVCMIFRPFISAEELENDAETHEDGDVPYNSKRD